MSLKKKALIDIVALVIYAIVATPALTGIPLHEWAGIAIFVVFIVHWAVNHDWVTKSVKHSLEKPTVARTGNLMLDILILITFIVCTVSGILISGTVLQVFSLYAEGYFFWVPLHAASAKVLLALIIVHIVVHWKWIVHVVRGRKGRVEDGREADEV